MAQIDISQNIKYECNYVGFLQIRSQMICRYTIYFDVCSYHSVLKVKKIVDLLLIDMFPCAQLVLIY